MEVNMGQEVLRGLAEGEALDLVSPGGEGGKGEGCLSRIRES